MTWSKVGTGVPIAGIGVTAAAGLADGGATGGTASESAATAEDAHAANVPVITMVQNECCMLKTLA